jgi:hypothetical protein
MIFGVALHLFYRTCERVIIAGGVDIEPMAVEF